MKYSLEQVKATSWHNIVVFNEGLVDVIEKYLKKGAKIYLEGELTTRKYQDKDGNDRYTTEVVLQGYNSNLTMLGSSSQNRDSSIDSTQEIQQTDNSFNNEGSDSSNDDEDIPF